MNAYAKIIRMNDEHAARALRMQVDSPGTKYDGGIVNEHTGIPSPSHGGTASYIASLASALVTPESRYYRDEIAAAALNRAADYMLRVQHTDGTISLGGTNFHSPPDTSFVVAGMAQVYRVLRSEPWMPLQDAAERVNLFLERTIPALVTGGCHTPNHRWVMTAALGALYQLFGRGQLASRADEWLAEGMDCTEDGEWTERSNGIYNTVSDIMLYYTAVYLDRPGLLKYVRRNLRMMLYMVHPDGEVVTDYSGRQDFGVPHDLSEYFLSYRIMAAHDRDPLFASMHDLTAKTITRIGPVNNHAMLGMLAFPCDVDAVKRTPLPDRYELLFNERHPVEEHLKRMEQVGHHSKILHSSMHTSFGAPLMRYRDRETSATVMSRTPSFFSLRHGEAKLLGVSVNTLFTPGNVPMESFAKTDNGIRMGTVMQKGYNSPIPAALLPESAASDMSPWYLLPHHLRAITHLQTHRLEAEVIREGGEWRIRLCTNDLEDVITQVVFFFPACQSLIGDGLEQRDGGLSLWKGGILHASSGRSRIELEGGAYEHRVEQMRGGAEPTGSIQAVVVNLLSPFNREFSIRLS
ncbi:hypothetical protein [Paenibacillus alkalitolerans]|uniref:hypothetical protein n=1 Tax=Paenibacillus alkalitolerans TaxID=2799335 RepID=UPI0018F4A17B|nr:hypothetical protein [Paenibacillus alkalitolerans]